ncbi:hypothetical protein FJZ31_29935 [Candidatus Poribacteria bacterium]|nr:hypothetical protein [Candidatus Poribacteria bacterium]
MVGWNGGKGRKGRKLSLVLLPFLPFHPCLPTLTTSLPQKRITEKVVLWTWKQISEDLATEFHRRNTENFSVILASRSLLRKPL